MVITKREDVIKQGFCKILLRKLRLRESLLLVIIQFFFLVRGGGGEGGVGAYSRLGTYQLFLSLGWALIRGGR